MLLPVLPPLPHTPSVPHLICQAFIPCVICNITVYAIPCKMYVQDFVEIILLGWINKAVVISPHNFGLQALRNHDSVLLVFPFCSYQLYRPVCCSTEYIRDTLHHLFQIHIIGLLSCNHIKCYGSIVIETIFIGVFITMKDDGCIFSTSHDFTVSSNIFFSVTADSSPSKVVINHSVGIVVIVGVYQTIMVGPQ